MKSDVFNICPTCIHRDGCVLTHNKSLVWACSEYEEALVIKNPSSINKVTEEEPEMAIV